MIDRNNYVNIPHKPGVYLFYDNDKKLLYIGKAKDLRKRVSQYFRNKVDEKTNILVSKIAYIDFLITKSESESLIVEQNLIQINKPQYNIQLKDGKSFPVIVVSRDKYPRIFIGRQKEKYKGSIYGPYMSTKSAKTLVDFIQSNFKIRTCKKNLNRKSKPCLNYHINKCKAPCQRFITEEDYNHDVKKAKQFLKGQFTYLLKDLKTKITDYSQQADFEKAMVLRDQYNKIDAYKKRFSYNYNIKSVTDFVAFYIRGDKGIVTLLRMSEGRKIFTFTNFFDNKGFYKDYFANVLFQVYDKALQRFDAELPEYIFLPFNIQSINYAFKDKYNNQKIEVKKYSTQREMKIYKQLLNHCSLVFRDTHIKSIKQNEKVLISLKDKIGLKKVPYIIDGFDISNFGSKIIVGSSVRFENGVPDRKNYRHYKMKFVKHQNDVESMMELIARRLKQFLDGKVQFADLLLIDGGKPQVNAVMKVMSRMGLDIDVIGLAKKEELIIIPGKKEPISFDFDSKELRLLTSIRDESHRFANRYREMLQYKFK